MPISVLKNVATSLDAGLDEARQVGQSLVEMLDHFLAFHVLYNFTVAK